MRGASPSGHYLPQCGHGKGSWAALALGGVGSPFDRGSFATWVVRTPLADTPDQLVGPWEGQLMKFDADKADEMALALLLLTFRRSARAWRQLDEASPDRLHDMGFASAPGSSTTSAFLTAEGQQRSQVLFEQFFKKK